MLSIAPAWRKPVAGVAVIVAAAMTASCSSGSAPAGAPEAAGESATVSATPAPQIKISPAAGSAKVKPNKKVVVTASGGVLDEVVVQGGGKQLEGDFNADKTKWVSKDPLRPTSSYSVSAKAGKTTAAASFKTLKPEIELEVADVTPNQKGEEVGVGAPIILTFNNPVSDKEAVEGALEVEAEKPVEGAWRWINDKTVIYRTATYWPAHQTVKLTARLNGVQGGQDMYGVKDYTTSIEIGAKQISKINTKTHMMYVYRDGKKVQTMRISAGMATTREYTTTSGVHLTMEKGNPVRMISPGRKKGDPGYYDVMINHAVRISNSGEYVHAKDNVWAQGRQNVSHGCINSRPDQAKWFFDNMQRGDVVDIKGTTRKLEWNNGWGFWQMPFKEWKKGSAL